MMADGIAAGRRDTYLATGFIGAQAVMIAATLIIMIGWQELAGGLLLIQLGPMVLFTIPTVTFALLARRGAPMRLKIGALGAHVILLISYVLWAAYWTLGMSMGTITGNARLFVVSFYLGVVYCAVLLATALLFLAISTRERKTSAGSE